MPSPFDNTSLPPQTGFMSGRWDDSAPFDQYPNAATPPPRTTHGEHPNQRVWDHIARRYPRKFRKALAYAQWLDRMYRRYEDKVV